jgi:hypothetical protein
MRWDKTHKSHELFAPRLDIFFLLGLALALSRPNLRLGLTLAYPFIMFLPLAPAPPEQPVVGEPLMVRIDADGRERDISNLMVQVDDVLGG